MVVERPATEVRALHNHRPGGRRGDRGTGRVIGGAGGVGEERGQQKSGNGGEGRESGHDPDEGSGTGGLPPVLLCTNRDAPSPPRTPEAPRKRICIRLPWRALASWRSWRKTG